MFRKLEKPYNIGHRLDGQMDAIVSMEIVHVLKGQGIRKGEGDQLSFQLNSIVELFQKLQRFL